MSIDIEYVKKVLTGDRKLAMILNYSVEI